MTMIPMSIPYVRYLSSDSHDDFGPVKKSTVPEHTKEVHDMIQDHITNNTVMLYMKGNPKQPMCGFSATVVQILQSYNTDFSSVNVLDYPTIRDGIKTFSNWPTVPQLYINGEFIGGCDIIKSMNESGELKDLLESLPKPNEVSSEEK
jgi:monothiol glutaredoxin